MHPFLGVLVKPSVVFCGLARLAHSGTSASERKWHVGILVLGYRQLPQDAIAIIATVLLVGIGGACFFSSSGNFSRLCWVTRYEEVTCLWPIFNFQLWILHFGPGMPSLKYDLSHFQLLLTTIV